MWASVQTVRGCPKHCSFCSVWRTDGQRPRQRGYEAVVQEIVELRRRGFRFIALADDNFYPVTLEDLRLADRREDKSQLHRLQEIRAERFALMAQLARLRRHRVLHADHDGGREDPEFLDGDEACAYQGRARRRRIGDGSGPEIDLQELSTRAANRSCSGCARSASTTSTCSARSSSASRRSGRFGSTRR